MTFSSVYPHVLPSSPGRDMLMMVSKSTLPCSSVERPISMLPVAVTSNRQNWSCPHMELACAASSGMAKVGAKAGTKAGL